MARARRVDANQREIVNALRRIGAHVIDVSSIPCGFDILVIHRGKTHIVEIKDENKPPSKRKLTENELNCKMRIELNGVKYNVIKNIDEAIEMIT